MRFSERMGLKPTKSFIQVDSMDEELRNSLWNALSLFYWEQVPQNAHLSYFGKEIVEPRIGYFCDLIRDMWIYFFKLPVNELRSSWKKEDFSNKSLYNEIKNYFFTCQWYEVYDFLEFIPRNYKDYIRDHNEKFMVYCNFILKRELSAYRFVRGKIAQITSEEEIASIEEATATTDQFKPVNIHLEQALDFLSDRKSPDYRNSIKESISAVESICKLISEDNKATLGAALKKMEPKVMIHPALKKAFDSLYGYTSDEGGIRHALLEESDLKFEDAKFMLVTCSAFINYLKAKLA